jgi:NADH dehydrogenase FAD-containing subunit
VAKTLDEIADVVLIEPRDTFVHNVAALRAVVEPEWVDQIFIPYDRLLTRGRLIRDRAVDVSGSVVRLASGTSITADYTVLATGSVHRYPARMDVDDAAIAKDKLRATHDALARSSRVLLLGAGPVGLEFAGEIRAAWADTTVTVVDPSPDLVSGRFPEEFRAELRAQLEKLGVEVLLGTSLRELPVTGAGEAGTFTVTTGSGVSITADIWFPCYGAAPATGYLSASDQVTVTPSLRVQGQENVFAIGDITALPEMKMARNAQKHAEVAVANVTALIEGRDPEATYQPEPDAIVLPLGPKGGVTYAPEVGVLGAEQTANIKSTFYLERYRELLGAGPGAGQ